MLTKLHWLAHKHAEASFVICRKRQVDLWATVIETWHKHIVAEELKRGILTSYGGEKPEWYDYPNGARIWTCGLDKAGKVLSGQHDAIFANQAEELTLADWELLFSTTTGRAGHVPYPQTIGDCNPGPPSHWIRLRARAGLLTLFQSTHRDNPALYNQATGEITEEGRRRIGALDRLTGARKKRYRYGLWAAPEGSVYGDVFEGLLESGAYGKHLARAFEIPRHWPRVVGIDPAGAKRAALWLAYDQQGEKLHVYREMALPFGRTVQDFAGKVLEAGQGEAVFAYVCGAKSERDWRVEFQAAGVPVTEPPVADFWVGIDRVLDLLQTDSLVVHDTCQQLLSEIEEYHRKQDKRTGEFQDVVEDKERFHMLDCLRYAVMWLTHREVVQQQVTYNPVKIGRY